MKNSKAMLCFNWLAFCVYVYLCICRLIALPIGRHYKLRENVSKPVVHNDTLEKLFKQHRKIYPSDNVILVTIIFLSCFHVLGIIFVSWSTIIIYCCCCSSTAFTCTVAARSKLQVKTSSRLTSHSINLKYLATRYIPEVSVIWSDCSLQ